MESNYSCIMETVLRLAVLLTFCTLMHANPLSTPECKLQPNGMGQSIKVSYVTDRAVRGCVSRSPAGTAWEVHVLSLRYHLNMEMASLQLNVSSAEGNVTQQRNVVFVIDSNPFVFVSVQSKDLSLTFVYNLSRLYVSGPNTKSNTSLPVFSSSEGLLQWVKETYGGITSFTELKNPQWIRFQVGEDASSPSDCIPKMDFNARSYLESEVSFQEVRSCKDPSMQERKEAHIVRVNQSLEETSPKSVEVELNVVCPGGEPVKEPAVLLILYSSQPDLSWKFCQMPGKIQFLASGKYSFQSMPPFVVNGTSLPDTKQGLISKAHEQGYNHIGSYTEVSSASRVTLQLHQCVSTERTRETTTLTSSHMPVSAIRHPVENVVLLCKPWRCMDDSIEIVLHKIFLQASRYSVISVTLQDPQCKAEQNETHFVLRSRLGSCDTDLEPWSKGFKAKNKLVLTLDSSQEKITVPFECVLPEKLFVELDRTPEFSSPSTVVEVNKVTYVQVSLRTASRPLSLVLQECSLSTLDKAPLQLLIRVDEPQEPSVQILNSPHYIHGKIWRFSFIYRTGDQGWSPPSFTLLCRVHLQPSEGDSYEHSVEVTLKTHAVQPPQSLGMAAALGITFGAFLIGALLTAMLWYIYSHTRPMTKMQPVSANQPAPESSSSTTPNHSIGSTQSTPCSTSSMA